MKYTMSGFNQVKLIELGLDLKDAALLRYFVDFKDTNSMSMIIVEGIPFYWVKYEALKDDLPILGINSNAALRRRLKKLEDCGILQHYHKLAGGSFSYYAIGDNYKSLLTENSSQDFNNYDVIPQTEKSDPQTEKSDPQTQKFDPSNSKVRPLKLKSSTPRTQKFEQNNPSTKDPSTKDPSTKDKGQLAFDVEIENYTKSSDLRTALYEFIKSRKAIKSPMTTVALNKLLTKLDLLATSENEKIEILNTSIINGWRGIFPLKQNKNPTATKTIGGFNNFEPRPYDYDSLEKKLLGWDKD